MPQPNEPYRSHPARHRLAVAALIAVLFMGSTLLTPFYGLYSARFGFSKLVLVLLYAVYVIGNLSALFLVGRLSDQIGRRPVALAGIAVAVVGTLCFVVAGATAWLFAGRILSGLAIGIGSAAATAWMAELLPRGRQHRSAALVTAANFAGLALGPIVAGALVQYAPARFSLSFLAYLALLALVTAAILATPETIAHRSVARLSLRPRIGVPSGIRLAFAAPALTVFATMGLVGFYAGLGPTMLSQDLHMTNLAASGAAVAELFAVAGVTVLLSTALSSRTAMIVGLALMPPGVGLLSLAQHAMSLPLLLAATALMGVAAALGYRGSLQVVDRIAPADRRAEIVAAYLVAAFSGNALLVIGVGVLSTFLDAQTADTAFAGVMAAIALVALGLALTAGSSREQAAT